MYFCQIKQVFTALLQDFFFWRLRSEIKIQTNPHLQILPDPPHKMWELHFNWYKLCKKTLTSRTRVELYKPNLHIYKVCLFTWNGTHHMYCTPHFLPWKQTCLVCWCNCILIHRNYRMVFCLLAWQQLVYCWLVILSLSSVWPQQQRYQNMYPISSYSNSSNMAMKR